MAVTATFRSKLILKSLPHQMNLEETRVSIFCVEVKMLLSDMFQKQQILAPHLSI